RATLLTTKTYIPALYDSLPICEGFYVMARSGILPFRSVVKAVNALRRLARHRRDAEMLRQPTIDPVRLDVGLEDFASMSEASAKDRKSTRLNSSHLKNSYAVIC